MDHSDEAIGPRWTRSAEEYDEIPIPDDSELLANDMEMPTEFFVNRLGALQGVSHVIGSIYSHQGIPDSGYIMQPSIPVWDADGRPCTTLFLSRQYMHQHLLDLERNDQHLSVPLLMELDRLNHSANDHLDHSANGILADQANEFYPYLSVAQSIEPASQFVNSFAEANTDSASGAQAVNPQIQPAVVDTTAAAPRARRRRARNNAVSTSNTPHVYHIENDPCQISGCPNPLHDTPRLEVHGHLVEYDDVPFTRKMIGVKKPQALTRATGTSQFHRALDRALRTLDKGKAGNTIPSLKRNLFHLNPRSAGNGYPEDGDDDTDEDDDIEEIEYEHIRPFSSEDDNVRDDFADYLGDDGGNDKPTTPPRGPSLRNFWEIKLYSIMSSPPQPDAFKYKPGQGEDEDKNDDKDPSNKSAWTIERDLAIKLWRTWQNRGLHTVVDRIRRHHFGARLLRLRVKELVNKIIKDHRDQHMRVPQIDSIGDCCIMKCSERLYVVAMVLRTLACSRVDVIDGNLDELVAAPTVHLSRKVASFWSNAKKQADNPSTQKRLDAAAKEEEETSDSDSDSSDEDDEEDEPGAGAAAVAPKAAKAASKTSTTSKTRAGRGTGTARGGRGGKAAKSSSSKPATKSRKRKARSPPPEESNSDGWDSETRLFYGPSAKSRGTRKRTRKTK